MNGYVNLGELGRGSFGRVIKARRLSDGQVFAIKLIPIDRGELEAIRKEAQLLFALNHSNVVRYYDSFVHTEKSVPYFCIVLEYAGKGSLYHLMQRNIDAGKTFPTQVIQVMLYQMAEALAYLHSRHLVHRDLKTDNILFSADGVLKLTDFGLVRIVSNQTLRTSTGGHICYQAPEQLTEGKVGPPVDMWALGCILSELVTLQFTFTRVESPSPFCLNRSALDQTVQDVSKYGTEFHTLLERMLCTDPSSRLTATELVEELKPAVLAFANEQDVSYLQTFDVLTRLGVGVGECPVDPPPPDRSTMKPHTSTPSLTSPRSKCHQKLLRTSLFCLNIIILTFALVCVVAGVLLSTVEAIRLFGFGRSVSLTIVLTGALLALVSLVGFAAARWKSPQLLSIYCVLLSVFMIGIAAAFIVLLVIVVGGGMQEVLHDQWKTGVGNNSTFVCDLQSSYQCGGFNKPVEACGSYCPPESSAFCTDDSPACYPTIKSSVGSHMVYVTLICLLGPVAMVCYVVSAYPLVKQWKVEKTPQPSPYELLVD